MKKKYIDAEKLTAKIKELNLVTKTYDEQVAFNNALAMVVEVITSLQQEQPKVDVEKEYKKWWDSIKYKINIEHVMEWYMHETARHFAEWGAVHLNVRKEE